MNKRWIIQIVFYLVFILGIVRCISARPSIRIQSQLSPEVLSEVDYFKWDSYFNEITDYCIKDNDAYILYGDKGILRIIDIKTQNSVTLGYLTTRGSNMLYVNDEQVFLEDNAHNIYCIKGRTQIGYYEKIDHQEYVRLTENSYNQLQKRASKNGSLQMHNSSIYYVQKDGTRQIIEKRPIFSILFQSFGWLFGFMLFILLFLLDHFLK